MFSVLVKFKGNPVPVLFGTTHVSHAKDLATMDGVEWASPTITGSGYVTDPAAMKEGFTGMVMAPFKGKESQS